MIDHGLDWHDRPCYDCFLVREDVGEVEYEIVVCPLTHRDKLALWSFLQPRVRSANMTQQIHPLHMVRYDRLPRASTVDEYRSWLDSLHR